MNCVGHKFINIASWKSSINLCVTCLWFSNTAKVIFDRETQRSRGFGFVSFADSESASSAKSAMDGQVINTSIIFIES